MIPLIKCIHCDRRNATWCGMLCADCASLTDAELREYKRTGHHPRVPNTQKPTRESNTLAWLLTNTLANVDRG